MLLFCWRWLFRCSKVAFGEKPKDSSTVMWTSRIRETAFKKSFFRKSKNFDTVSLYMSEIKWEMKPSNNEYKSFLRHLYVKIDISQFIIIDKCCSFHYSFCKYNSCVFPLGVTDFSLVHTRVREQIGMELSLASQGWNLPSQVSSCFSFQKYKWRRVPSCILSGC